MFINSIMAKTTRNNSDGLLLFITIVLNLILAYCLIKYTKTMNDDTICSSIKSSQREMLYFGGVLILATNIFVFIKKCGMLK